MEVNDAIKTFKQYLEDVESLGKCGDHDVLTEFGYNYGIKGYSEKGTLFIEAIKAIVKAAKHENHKARLAVLLRY